MERIVSLVSGVLTDYVMVITLLFAAVMFTYRTRGVQFRMIGEMCRLLVNSGKIERPESNARAHHHGSVSSFQAFAISIASRVGTEILPEWPLQLP